MELAGVRGTDWDQRRLPSMQLLVDEVAFPRGNAFAAVGLSTPATTLQN
jgi:hypothetical protein